MNEEDPDSMAGYPATPLFEKLKIKPGFLVAFEIAPESFEATIGPLPIDAVDVGANQTELDLVVIFTTSRNELTRKFQAFSKRLTLAGMLSVAWPKKSSGKATDLIENFIREFASRPDSSTPRSAPSTTFGRDSNSSFGSKTVPWLVTDATVKQIDK